MHITMSEATGFSKRMAIAEQKLDAMKEITDKRHESLKDYVGKTKDMLESRADQMIVYDDKISIVLDEIKKAKAMQFEF